MTEFQHRPRSDKEEPPLTTSKQFRARLARVFDLDDVDPIWDEVLAQVCGILDRLDQIQARLKKDGLTSTGSKGQVTIHPLLAEERQQRLAAARLMERLGLSDDETQSDRQRHNANRRWRKS